MTIDEIKALIEAMAGSELAEMHASKDGWTLVLRRHAKAGDDNGAPPHALPASRAPPTSGRRSLPRPTAPKPSQANKDAVAPLSGIVHLAPAPGAAPFVTPGQTIEPGALLCTIEAMKTFNEVRAAGAGVLSAVLVATGDEVEAGQSLMRLG